MTASDISISFSPRSSSGYWYILYT